MRHHATCRHVSRLGALAALVGGKACHLGAIHGHGWDNVSCSSVDRTGRQAGPLQLRVQDSACSLTRLTV